MSSNRFYTAEKLQLSQSLIFHDKETEVMLRIIQHLSQREEFHINKPILNAQGTDQNDQMFESSIENEQEAVVIGEDSTSELLSSSPEARVKKVKNAKVKVKKCQHLFDM